VTWPDFAVDHERLGGALRKSGLAIRLAPKLGSRTSAEVLELANGASAAIVSTDPFPADVLAQLSSLEVIARVGVGVDSIDLDAATANGIAVTVAPGANEAVVAEHTVAMMLALIRRLPEQDRNIRAAEWNRTGAATPWSLDGACVGLIGFGRIGRLVAERLAGFDVKLLASDPAIREDEAGVKAVQLDELLEASDVVSVHCPLLPSTERLIGARELGLMGRDAMLVNTARGGIVDEEALIEALENGRLRGAALDVFSHEPPTDGRLLELPNVLMSPHNAGLSETSVFEMTRMATASVIDVLSGRIPPHLANPAVFENGRAIEHHGAGAGEVESA
jgi:phosphoglycerate dehydrogenase-like enzyme